MRLSELLEGIDAVRPVGEGDPEIRSVVCDSRQCQPGCLFAGLPGVKTDGAVFAARAVEAGAVALLLHKEIEGLGAPQVIARDPRHVLARIAAALHGHPSRSLRLIGVTGTNGKTTVAYGLRHVLRHAGEPVGMLGTIEYDTGKEVLPAPLTTPESTDFCRYLAAMRDAGAAYAVAEVSSHALAQNRVAAHEFACAVFTNLTRDHLDYHGDMAGYGAAKKRLFDGLPASAVAVVNGDDPFSTPILADCRARGVTYGLCEQAAVRGRIEQADLRGTVVNVTAKERSLRVATPLIGEYNILNMLAVIAAAMEVGVDIDAAAESLATFSGAPGRMERFSGDGVTVFVDYAHTDDALRSALSVLRPLTQGRLFVVFGCGGDRDRGKRPLMARAAEDVADRIVLTDDNPRSEDPVRIIADIQAGLNCPERVAVERDRAAAIAMAVAQAEDGDAVLVAGKGHEDYQIVGSERLHLDDRELVADAIGGRGGLTGAA